ncbi:hypothetical protein INR49_032490 [Caranx melampygus]|nr:hypothetical protein INR49_032490 [Caranx melampygus]
MRFLAFGLFCLFCCNAAQLDRRRPRPMRAKGKNETAVQIKAKEAPCKAIPLDFFFVIDSSRSIRPNDYEKVKTFIINLIQFLKIGPDATRVGLLQYGSIVQPEFSLKTYTTKAEVEQAVRNMVHLATGTMTGLAIQYTMETAFTEEEGARPASLHIPRIAMVVTDGRPQDTVEEVAAQAREAGIQIFAIGVGRVDMNTLKAIGSEPHSEHVHLVANFSQIETLISVFQSKLCGGSEMCEVVDHQCQHICVSSPASYRCKCREGFTLNPDGKTCKEIDYCDLGNHGCEHDCVSVPESYICRCNRGYVLNLDGKTCSKIDHCADGTHGCEQEFMNTDDSCVCKCRKGYTLRPDGKTCKKIDHCADGTHGCEQEFMNTDDSCVCKCRKGYTLRPDGKTCKKKDTHCDLTAKHVRVWICVRPWTMAVSTCVSAPLIHTSADVLKALCWLKMGRAAKSLGPANFEVVKQFVNGIVSSLDISKTGTHVGLLQYSTKVRTEFTLGQYTTVQGVKQAVSRMQYMGRGSMTGSALRHMYESSFSAKEGARANIPRVCVVFTDGRSQDDVSEWATKAKNSGITMYVLGIGKAIEQELREIASEPDEKHLYYAEDFEKMGEITKKLKSRICTDKPSDVNMCECENVMMFQNQVTEKLKNLVL